jgi:hypothetical protein
MGNIVRAFSISQTFPNLFTFPLDIPLDIVLSYTVHYCGALRSFHGLQLWKSVVSSTLSCGSGGFLSGAESAEIKAF